MSWPPQHAKLVLDGKVVGEQKTAGSKKVFVARSNKAPNPYTGQPDGAKHAVPVRTKDGGTTAKAHVVDDSGTPGKEWRKAIQDAVADIRETTEVLDVPLVLEVVFFRPRGQSMYGSGANATKVKDSAPAYPVARPDGTKLCRAFEDALSKILWRDDSLIVSCRWDKRFVPITDPPMVQFRLWSLPTTVSDQALAIHNQEQAALNV